MEREYLVLGGGCDGGRGESLTWDCLPELDGCMIRSAPHTFLLFLLVNFLMASAEVQRVFIMIFK